MAFWIHASLSMAEDSGTMAEQEHPAIEAEEGEAGTGESVEAESEAESEASISDEPVPFWTPSANGPVASDAEARETADEEESSPESASSSEPAAGVLRFGTVELSPDLKIYADYQFDAASEDVENGFHVTRAYLGLRVRVTPWLSGRVTYDVSQATDLGRAGPAEIEPGTPGEDEDTAIVDGSRVQGSMLARLKYAYINFGIERLSLDVRFGVVHTPWIDWIEHIEDTRFLRKVMIENEYHYPSADFGLALAGNIRDYLAYFVGVYNGEGYHGIEDTRFKDFIARVSLRPVPGYRPLTALQLSGYVQVEVPIPDSASGQETHRRFGGALTYRLADEITSPDCAKVRGERLALWFQAFYGQDGVADAITDSFGFSVGGRVELPARLFLLARLDRFDSDLDVDGEDDVFWTVLAAFGFRPTRGVIVALNYQARLGPGDDRHLIGIHTELHL